MSTEAKTIRASFLETEEHFVDAWDHRPGKKRSLFYALIAIVLFHLLQAPDVLRRRSRGQARWWMEYALTGTASALICLWLSPVGQRWQVRRAARKNVSEPPSTAWFEFSEAGFLSAGKDGRSSFHPWTTVPSAIRFEDGLSLTIDKQTEAFFWLPRDAFASAADYAEVVALLTAKVASVTQQG